MSQYALSYSWEGFIPDVKGKGNLNLDIANISHMSVYLLSCFQKVVHLQSCQVHHGLLEKLKLHLNKVHVNNFIEWKCLSLNKFTDMMENQQRIVLPATMINKMFGL